MFKFDINLHLEKLWEKMRCSMFKEIKFRLMFLLLDLFLFPHIPNGTLEM